ncbi:MAG: aldo/keto reductase, partial [Acidimicrobiales bacterium]
RIAHEFPAFAEVAAELGTTPEQVTLAWMLAKGSRVIPIPGSSRPATATASAAAADLTLTAEHVARLDAA